MTWLNAVARIVEHHQYETIHNETGEPAREGDPGAVLLDATTAHMLWTVASALNPENRARLEALPLTRAVEIGWKLVR